MIGNGRSNNLRLALKPESGVVWWKSMMGRRPAAKKGGLAYREYDALV